MRNTISKAVVTGLAALSLATSASPRPSRLRPRSGTAAGGAAGAPVTGTAATGAATFGTAAGGPGRSGRRSLRSGRCLSVLRLRLLRHLLAEFGRCQSKEESR